MLLRAFSRTGTTRPGGKPTAARVVRRMLIVAALVVAVFVFQRNTFQRLSDQFFGARIDWHSDYAVSEHLYDMIVRRRLTDIKRACLLLNIHGGDPADAQNIDVFERPTPACMGPDAGRQHVLPRLFGLRVDRDAGTVLTDSGSPGQFHALN